MFREISLLPVVLLIYLFFAPACAEMYGGVERIVSSMLNQQSLRKMQTDM